MTLEMVNIRHLKKFILLTKFELSTFRYIILTYVRKGNLFRIIFSRLI